VKPGIGMLHISQLSILSSIPTKQCVLSSSATGTSLARPMLEKERSYPPNGRVGTLAGGIID